MPPALLQGVLTGTLTTMPQRGITAIMFDIALVEQCFAAPTRPNRT